MDVVVKTEPPDDTEYLHAASVPEDSQWQKKRSKLHNLLFGGHGNSSSRVSTPEPQPQFQGDLQGLGIVKHEDAETTSITTATDYEKRYDNDDGENTLADGEIVVKLENVEDDETFQSYTKNVLQPETNNSLSTPTVKSLLLQNGSHDSSAQLYIQNAEQDSRSSLLKSMLTCPMSNINSPILENFQSVFNENSQSKQNHSSEIRKMLSEPLKSGSPAPSKSVSLSSNQTPKLSSLLGGPIFSSSKTPRTSSSASSLLMHLSARSQQRSDMNSPSFSGLRIPEKTSQTALRNSPSNLGISPSVSHTKDRKQQEYSKVVQQSKDLVTHIEESTKSSELKDDTLLKTKAVEDAVDKFSQFLQKTMSKHEFSGEQMKFIMESAMKSASRVITEAAEKTNVSDNMRATATNFIENAIGNVIRTETLRKETNKSAEMIDGILQKRDTGKKTLKKGTSKASKRRANADVDIKDEGSKATNRKIKKRKIKEKESPEDQLLNDKIGPFPDDKDSSSFDVADKINTEPIETEGWRNKLPVITIKEEPVEFDDIYPNHDANIRKGGIEEEQIEVVSQLGQCFSKSQDKISDGSPVNQENPKQTDQDIETEVDSSKEGMPGPEYDFGSVVPADAQIKTEPDTVLKDIDTTQEILKSHKNFPKENGNQKSSVAEFLEDQISKNLKEPLSIEKALKCPRVVEQEKTNENSNMLFLNTSQQEDDSEKSVKQSGYICETCGLEFEHKGSLRVHERGHNPKNDKSFQCLHCGKCVTDASYLKLHMYTHKNENVTSNNIEINDGQSEANEGKNKELVKDCDEEESKQSYLMMAETDKMIKDKNSRAENNISFDREHHLNAESETKNGDVRKSYENDGSCYVPDLSLVKVEPGIEHEDQNSVQLTENSTNATKVDDIMKRNETFVSFLDQEIEKSLKEKFGIVSYKETNTNQSLASDGSGKPMMPPVFKCETCGQEFEHKGTLKVHQRGHNFKNKSFQCPICGRFVTDASYLKIHMRTHQNEEAFGKQGPDELKCEVCKLQFSSNEHFQIHQRMHNGEKLFKCQECDTGFTSKNQLNLHERIHKGLRPYKCHICDMSFRQHSGLKLHLLVHTDDKPKKCPFCAASFSRKAHLDKHIRYHSGERPFVCEICSKAFVDKELMKQHVKNVHANGKLGKRGPYKARPAPYSVGEKLGPNWRGFVGTNDSGEPEIKDPCYPCGVCGETFSEITVLVDHLESHSNSSQSESSTVSDNPQSAYAVSDSSFGNLHTDYAVSGFLNSNSPPNPSGFIVPGSISSSEEKAFKCPFCDESFDLPGPRIRHIHESHPFKNSTAGLNAAKDGDYLMNLHLIEQRSMDYLYGADNNKIVGKTQETNSQSLVGALLKPNAIVANTSTPAAFDNHVVNAENDLTPTSPQKQNLIKLPCPYCDRVYHRQSSRTRHINENHRDKKEAFRLMQEIKGKQLHS